LDKIFSPNSVAVVGASGSPGKVGYVLLSNLKKTFRGKIYPVNLKEKEILGFEAYPNLNEIPGPVDIAVITTPARTVPDLIKDCGKKKIEYAIILTGGFGEFGKDGQTLSDQILANAKGANVSIIGPNSLGVICGTSGFRATFSPEVPTAEGNLALISQSGGIWRIAFDRAEELGFGVEKFVGSGNEIDLTMADYIELLKSDEQIKVILLYIEGLKVPRKFLQIAKEVSKVKPIVAMKAGVTKAGSSVTLTHSASLAGSARIYEGLFKQCGVVQVADPVDLVDSAILLSTDTGSKFSNGVAILGAGGGVSAIAADAFEKHGFEVQKFSRNVLEGLKKILKDVSILDNPVDLGMTPTDERGYRNLEYFGGLALSEQNISWLVLVNNVDIFSPEEVLLSARKLQDEHPEKKVLTVWYSAGIPTLKAAMRKAGQNKICAFTSVDEAAVAARNFQNYIEWRARHS
jgi:acyl-CoA synthetase (NDP forming)